MSPRRRASTTAKKTKKAPSKATEKPTVLVTGDVVLDCHLYSAGKTSGGVFLGTETARYKARLGGAALTKSLLEAAANAERLDYDAQRAHWQAENEQRREAGKTENPETADLAAGRPSPAYDVGFAFVKPARLTSLRISRSYGVWTGQPARRDSKDRVWRVDGHFGYEHDKRSTSRGSTSRPLALDLSKAATRPLLTVIDDGALMFRNTRSLWPEFRSARGHFLLKMSGPICRGDLWRKLRPVMDRLIVVVSADDLRREDVQISRRLSWERTVEETREALQSDRIVSQLRQAAHAIVVFGSEGALSIHHQGRGLAYVTFDPLSLEGQHAREFVGTTYGFQTCFTVAIAHHLMTLHLEAKKKTDGQEERRSPFDDPDAMLHALQTGIGAGLATKRALLEWGHGPVTPTIAPGFPIRSLVPVLDRPAGFASVRADALRRRPARTILAQSALPDDVLMPLKPLARLVARDGLAWLADVPLMKMGDLTFVDRTEIESLRTIEALIHTYRDGGVQTKPLSIGVFGPPGAGKSTGVKAVAKEILGKEVPFLEFNLSQFKNPEDLIGPFHRVRDAVLAGTTPVAFWDEFDSQEYKWLQYLLAPMQDGAFQQGEITHPIGKCIFIFAGGTSATLAEFGIKNPATITADERGRLSPKERQTLPERYEKFKLLKGPDFISRLHGFLDVLGPNPRELPGRRRAAVDPADISWPIRRALFVRQKMKLKDDQELKIDHGLLHALLSVSKYRYGARSLEKVLTPLMHAQEKGRMHRAALPPERSLDRDVDQREFNDLIGEYDDTLEQIEQLEPLAAAYHEYYRNEARKSQHEAAALDRKPTWVMEREVDLPYDELPLDKKKSNLAAVRRMAEHLALIQFTVMPKSRSRGGSWKRLRTAIARNIELLAEAEHRGWYLERRASGWIHGPVLDNERKQHPRLVEWRRLRPIDRDKDRRLVEAIPRLLRTGGLIAVPTHDR